MHSPLRNAVRAAALSTPLVLALTVPATAWATPPVTWEDPPPMSLLHALLLFGGVPLALFVLIALLTVAPSVARGSDSQRGVDRWATPQWFNGPRAGESVGGTREPQALAGGAGSATTGGADSYAGASSAHSSEGGASALAHSPAGGHGASGTGPGETSPAERPTAEARGRHSSPDADVGPARDVVPVAADTGGGASARW